jgi:predicted DNA-binding protein
MSSELKDLRAKITPRTNAVLEALNRTTGRDKSEIVREILEKWADEQIHAATLIDRLLVGEGEPGISEGASGKSGESTARSAVRAVI